MNLFTVEQLELVRRLRLSGMSVDSIIEAYLSLDQIENELNFTKTSPTTDKSPPVLTRSTPLQTSPSEMDASSPIIRQISSQTSQQRAITVPESCLFGAPLLSVGLPAQKTDDIQLIPTSEPSMSTTQSTTNFSFSIPASTRANIPNLSVASTSSSLCRPLRPTQQQFRGQRPDVALENPAELDEFMQQGEEFCINEMKKFITQYSLRQTTVAQLTGVSQPYISKLLNGNHRELSLRCRRNIYSWYLSCRRHPAIYCQDPTTRLETNCDGELVPQRRERYVFRPILIRILEAYFADSAFPDTQKRAEISQACNNALLTEKRGIHLMPKEIVTPQVIANWFANKRKEMRRKSNEENRPKNTLPSSEIPSSPSPTGSSSTLNAESPIEIAFRPGLLGPLQFPQNSFLIPPSIENFLEARPTIFQLGTTVPTSISEFLFNKSALQHTGKLGSMSSFPLQNLMTTQFSTNNQVQSSIGSAEAQPAKSSQDDPPVLTSIKDENENEANSEEGALKMMESQSQLPTSGIYADFFQKMLDSGMINMLHQQMNS